MKASRIVTLIIGCLLALPALAILASGALATIFYAVQGQDGYFDVTIDELSTSTAAITAERIDLQTEPGGPGWVVDAVEADVRLQVTPADDARPLFIGIASEESLDAYLAGVAHQEIRDFSDDGTPRYQSRPGTSSVAAPGSQDFWEASTISSEADELIWTATSGQWAVAVMNADGSPGVAADVNVGVESDVVLPVAIVLMAVGLGLGAISLALILFGVIGLAADSTRSPTPGSPQHPVGSTATSAGEAVRAYPLAIEAELESNLSRWMWLVKWFLAIPHMILLLFLWAAFFLLTVVAGIAIVFTGRYPRGIFDFNVGVIRWSWRVSYYAFSGGMGTDQYPPFSLGPEPDYPATVDIAYPERLSKGLVLVKWWLLAIPHYVVVAVLTGGGAGWNGDGNSGWDTGFSWGPGAGGLVGLLTLIAVVILAFSGSYPRPLFDLILGMNRWVYRVLAYAALMTDDYPPFRLDQGGSEPEPSQPLGTPPMPASSDERLQPAPQAN